MEHNIFEAASRLRLRFQSDKGNLSVEHLWNTPLPVLDDLYGSVMRELDDDAPSLLRKKTAARTELSLKAAILKHVVETRQAETEAAAQRTARRAQATRIRELIAQKQDQSLADKSIDELNNLLNELDT